MSSFKELAQNTAIFVGFSFLAVMSFLIFLSTNKDNTIPEPVPIEMFYMDKDLESVYPRSASLHYLRENGEDYIVVELDTTSERKVTLKWLRRYK